jgi:hypothetical protein
MTRMAVYGRNNSETYVATDAMGSSHGTPGSHEESLSEMLTFTDTVTRQVTFGRAASDAHAASDALSRLAIFARGFPEGLAVSDIVAAFERRGRNVPANHIAILPLRPTTGILPPH